MKRSKTLTPRLIKDLKQFSAKLKLTQQRQSTRQLSHSQHKIALKNTLKQQTQSQSQFIPFIYERKLGKLILPKQQSYHINYHLSSHPQILSQRINSRNFKFYYKKQKKMQQDQVISKTRIPDQRNLVYENQEWKKIGIRKCGYKNKKDGGQNKYSNIQTNYSKQKQQNDGTKIKTQKQFKITRYDQKKQQLKLNLQSSLRSCCRSNLLKYITKNNNSQHNHQKKNCFQKINQHLYKKINLFRPPSEDNPQLNALFEHFATSSELNQNIRREIITERPKKTFVRHMDKQSIK